MTPRGPKPKPAAQRRREGNPGKRRIKDPPDPTGLPERPAVLTGPAAEEWDRAIPLLVELKVAGKLNTGPLIALCVNWGIAEQAREVFETDGLVEEGSMGQMTEHPLLSTYRNAIATYIRIATEFGMTASAVMRVEAAKRGEVDPLASIGPSPRLRAVK